ncbi:MAG: hypothetical protein V1818_01860 [Candidatus Aenigmatarchaeota archaeon]
MRAIRKFEGFIKEGVVKKQSRDKSRADFLLKESENSYKSLLRMLVKIKLDDSNANLFVKMCYDIVMEMLRAKMLLEGYNASGQGAHEAEVSYMRVLEFDEKDVQFADQLRYFRNGMLYYGTILDRVYAEKVVKFLKRMYPKMKSLTRLEKK